MGEHAPLGTISILETILVLIILYLVKCYIAGFGWDVFYVVVDENSMQGPPLSGPPNNVERGPGDRFLSSCVTPVLPKHNDWPLTQHKGIAIFDSSVSALSGHSLSGLHDYLP